MNFFKNLFSFGKNSTSSNGLSNDVLSDDINMPIPNSNDAPTINSNSLNRVFTGNNDSEINHSNFENTNLRAINNDQNSTFANNTPPEGNDLRFNALEQNPIQVFMSFDFYSSGFRFGYGNNNIEILETNRKKILAESKLAIKKLYELKRNDLHKIELTILNVSRIDNNAELHLLTKEKIENEMSELDALYNNDQNDFFQTAYLNFEAGFKSGLRKFVNEEFLLNNTNIFN